MKKIIFALISIAVIYFSACTPKSISGDVSNSTTDSITISVIDPQFFIYKNDTIKNHRDLLWNFSLWEFGTGTNWKEWVRVNPGLQKPGRTWIDTISGHWIALVKYGEVFLHPQPVKFEVPVKVITRFSIVEVSVKDSDYLLWVIPSLLILLIVIYFLYRNYKKQEQLIEEKNKKEAQDYTKIFNLERDLEKVKNKIPVKAPEIADEEWLKNNFSVGDQIPSDNVEVASNAISRVYGKKPDLIIQAKVSTVGNSVNMEFSHDRKAITGLEDVVVYIGWDWVKKNWVEVGMLAGPCSNGFEANSNNVVKGQLFTKVELVDKTRHPVLFTGENVPKGAKYPELVKSLVLKYHGINIVDIKKAGAGVIVPKSLK
jgi:hypothetical protein